jgi:hypothetical protein
MRRQALSAEYLDYVSALKRIPANSDIRTQLDELRQQQAAAGSGQNVFARDPDKYGRFLRSANKRIAWELDHAIHRIASGSKPAATVFADVLADAQALQMAYEAHSVPEP